MVQRLEDRHLSVVDISRVPEARLDVLDSIEAKNQSGAEKHGIDINGCVKAMSIA